MLFFESIFIFFHSQNPFIRCIILAVSFGGDTDTIACMAGAIAGAFWGLEALPVRLVSVCEAHNKLESFAEQLFQIPEGL